jgi:hypothetical protein
MNYWGHAITSNMAVIGLAAISFLLGKPVWSVGLFLTFFMGFSFADADLRMGAHRHWFHHSTVPCVFLLVILAYIRAVYPAMPHQEVTGAAAFCISHGMHLLCDLKLDKKGKRGSYLIALRHGDRMSVNHTDGWLVCSGLGAICMALILVCWG